MTARTAMTRRYFLRASTIGGTLLMVQTTPVAAAIEGLVTRDTMSSLPLAAPDIRVLPVVVRRGPTTVTITQQFPFPPLAYFEKEAGKIYVDPEYGDSVIKVLNAKINGGTWTFDVDNPLVEVAAKEEGYDRWDKMKAPQIGDFRIVNRSPVTVRWEFNRLPVYDSGPRVWWEGDPIQHSQRVGREMTPGREDYTVVGVCNAYADSDCTRFVGKLDVLNWVALG